MFVGEVFCLSTGNAPGIVAIIPARYASERFPGKVIMPLAGKPLVAHTYDRTRRASRLTDVIVAVDDERVVDALRPYDVKMVMTRRDHATGSDRIAEVAAGLDADIIVNVQGDEPLVDPELIDESIQPLLDDPDLQMATARHAIDDPVLYNDSNCVKVACDQNGRALYFSRSRIPFIRDERINPQEQQVYWQHIGLYVFRREFLLKFASMPSTPLERLEKLEQLRVLENGYDIAVVEARTKALGVDTPADLARAEAILAERRSKP
jgi:3-deoxy-manno-octulosonate cytidylyltransferase (CMP-KDO synthetase)